MKELTVPTKAEIDEFHRWSEARREERNRKAVEKALDDICERERMNPREVLRHLHAIMKTLPRRRKSKHDRKADARLLAEFDAAGCSRAQFVRTKLPGAIFADTDYRTLEQKLRRLLNDRREFEKSAPDIFK